MYKSVLCGGISLTDAWAVTLIAELWCNVQLSHLSFLAGQEEVVFVDAITTFPFQHWPTFPAPSNSLSYADSLSWQWLWECACVCVLIHLCPGTSSSGSFIFRKRSRQAQLDTAYTQCYKRKLLTLTQTGIYHTLITFTHLADAFIQSDLQCIQAYLYCQYMCSLGIEPTTFALLTQCSTTEPQEHIIMLYIQCS